MAKQSAGLLVYHRKNGTLEVFLGHPGGPFWAKKDKGVWSLPKGEFDEEDSLTAAKREFKEETGHVAPEGDCIDLGSTKLKSGKTIFGWAVEGDIDASNIQSNTFEMEWPPRSGEKQEFPEIDRAAWFTLDKALQKIHPGQLPLLERLAEQLGEKLDIPEQASLF
jgi:predicted NUDIX family NTP pyrophosphohydrolase